MSSQDELLQPAAGAKPVGPAEPFHTSPSNSGNENGSSSTSGLSGTTQKFDDGTIVTEAVEQLHAKRVDGLDDSLVGHWRRVQKGNSFAIRQRSYSYKGRELPDGALFLNQTGIPAAVPEGFTATAVKHVKATQLAREIIRMKAPGLR
jgi:hypothetical protein